MQSLIVHSERYDLHVRKHLRSIVLATLALAIQSIALGDGWNVELQVKAGKFCEFSQVSSFAASNPTESAILGRIGTIVNRLSFRDILTDLENHPLWEQARQCFLKLPPSERWRAEAADCISRDITSFQLLSPSEQRQVLLILDEFNYVTETAHGARIKIPADVAEFDRRSNTALADLCSKMGKQSRLVSMLLDCRGAYYLFLECHDLVIRDWSDSRNIRQQVGGDELMLADHLYTVLLSQSMSAVGDDDLAIDLLRTSVRRTIKLIPITTREQGFAIEVVRLATFLCESDRSSEAMAICRRALESSMKIQPHDETNEASYARIRILSFMWNRYRPEADVEKLLDVADRVKEQCDADPSGIFRKVPRDMYSDLRSICVARSRDDLVRIIDDRIGLLLDNEDPKNGQ